MGGNLKYKCAIDYSGYGRTGSEVKLGSVQNGWCTCVLLEYPEKRHCCSCIVYVWILTDSGVNPGGADRDPSDVWARGAVHSSTFNMDRRCAIALICTASLPS